MNQHTRLAQEWLDRRYSRDSQGGYLAHQPICGLRTERAEPNAILRFARTYRLLELLHGVEFDSVLDVGGGEGYLAALVRDLFGAKTVHSSDLSVQACQRASEIFDIRGAAADSTRLPFADGSYDLVICSEVIEHLSRPVLAIGELARIARKYVVISTAEFCPAGELERALRSFTLDRSYPHSEVNWFTAGDFRGLLGDRTVLGAQYRSLEHLLPTDDSNRDRVEKILALLTRSHTLDVDHTGVIMISPRNGAAAPREVHADAQQKRRILNRLLEPPTVRAGNGAASTDTADPQVVSRIRCLQCRGALKETGGVLLTCVDCGQRYDVRSGVPAMFLETPDGSRARVMEEECVAVLSGGAAGRVPVVRKVIGRLHNNETRSNPEWKQRVATQLLRVLWLWSREESMGAKIGRLIGRFAGKPPVGSEEVQAVLFAPAESARPVDVAAHRQSLSKI